MANINNIIQEINTNFPDNNTQRITAQKLRETLIDELYETTEIYDVSANNNGNKYINLNAALGTNGANVPDNIRKGGMTVRFINSSTNKYEQWRYMLSSTTNDNFANVTNWQGIDNEPTQNSNNLVKSGGAYSAIQASKEIALSALDEIANADNVPTQDSNNLITSGAVYTALQDAGGSGDADKLIYDLGGYEDEPETITLFQGALPSSTRTIDCYIEVGDELQIELNASGDYVNLRTNSEVIYYKQGGTVQTNNIVNGKFTATKKATSLLVTGYSTSSVVITQNVEKLNIVSEVESLQGVQSEVDELVNSLGGITIYENTIIDNQPGATSEKTVLYNVKAGQKFRINFSGDVAYVSLKTNSEIIYIKVGGTVQTNNIVDGVFTATSDATQFLYSSYSGLSFTVIALENRIGIVSDVEDNSNNIGNLTELETENTDNLVNAINEVNRSLPEQESITKYVVMRGGGGGTTESIYPWDIKRGDKFTIFRDDTGDVTYCVVKSYLNGNQVQQFVRYVGGNPSGDGRLGVEIEATGNADSFGIASYGKYSITTTVKKMNVEVEVEKRLVNRLYGKRWLLIGDSISTEGSSWAVKGYGHYISQSLGMYYYNIAVGGKTMQWGCQQVPSQDNNYDLITVMLGTNNEGYNMGIGNISDAPDASSTAYIPATKAMIELLRAKYPKSVIIFITPIRRCNVDAQGNVDNHNVALKGYVDALIEVCNLYCIPVIDLWNIIAPEIDSIRSLFFCGTHEAGSDQDGTHPNELGHQMFLAPVIEEGIIKHSQFYFNDWNNQ